MAKDEKVRIETRFDAIKDKEIIDFIDNNGSTRAGFIKQIIKMYKNQIEGVTPLKTQKPTKLKKETEITIQKRKENLKGCFFQ